MQSRDEKGEGCHALGSTGGSRNPGMPAGFGNGVPNSAPRAERGLWSLVCPCGSQAHYWGHGISTSEHLLILAVVFQPHFFPGPHQILLKNPRELWDSSSHPFFAVLCFSPPSRGCGGIPFPQLPGKLPRDTFRAGRAWNEHFGIPTQAAFEENPSNSLCVLCPRFHG